MGKKFPLALILGLVTLLTSGAHAEETNKNYFEDYPHSVDGYRSYFVHGSSPHLIVDLPESTTSTESTAPKLEMLQFSPDGSKFMRAPLDKDGNVEMRIEIFDLKTQKKIRELKPDFDDWTYGSNYADIQFTPDSKSIRVIERLHFMKEEWLSKISTINLSTGVTTATEQVTGFRSTIIPGTDWAYWVLPEGKTKDKMEFELRNLATKETIPLGPGEATQTPGVVEALPRGRFALVTGKVGRSTERTSFNNCILVDLKTRKTIELNADLKFNRCIGAASEDGKKYFVRLKQFSSSVTKDLVIDPISGHSTEVSAQVFNEAAINYRDCRYFEGKALNACVDPQDKSKVFLSHFDGPKLEQEAQTWMKNSLEDPHFDGTSPNKMLTALRALLRAKDTDDTQPAFPDLLNIKPANPALKELSIVANKFWRAPGELTPQDILLLDSIHTGDAARVLHRNAYSGKTMSLSAQAIKGLQEGRRKWINDEVANCQDLFALVPASTFWTKESISTEELRPFLKQLRQCTASAHPNDLTEYAHEAVNLELAPSKNRPPEKSVQELGAAIFLYRPSKEMEARPLKKGIERLFAELRHARAEPWSVSASSLDIEGATGVYYHALIHEMKRPEARGRARGVEQFKPTQEQLRKILRKTIEDPDVLRADLEGVAELLAFSGYEFSDEDIDLFKTKDVDQELKRLLETEPYKYRGLPELGAIKLIGRILSAKENELACTKVDEVGTTSDKHQFVRDLIRWFTQYGDENPNSRNFFAALCNRVLAKFSSRLCLSDRMTIINAMRSWGGNNPSMQYQLSCAALSALTGNEDGTGVKRPFEKVAALARTVGVLSELSPAAFIEQIRAFGQSTSEEQELYAGLSTYCFGIPRGGLEAEGKANALKVAQRDPHAGCVVKLCTIRDSSVKGEDIDKLRLGIEKFFRRLRAGLGNALPAPDGFTTEAPLPTLRQTLSTPALARDLEELELDCKSPQKASVIKKPAAAASGSFDFDPKRRVRNGKR